MKIPKKEPLALTVRTKVSSVDLSKSQDGVHRYGFEPGEILRCGAGARPLPPLFGDSLAPSGETLRAAFAFANNSATVYALCCESGRVYAHTASGIRNSGATFHSIPACARVYDSEEAFLLSDGSACVKLSASGVTAQSSTLAFSAAAFYGDRLWTANKTSRIRYSAPANIRDFTAQRGRGGWIDLPDQHGKILAMFPFRNALYLFWERGAQRLEGKGDEQDFRVEDAFSCPRIYADTIVAAGDRLVWLTEEGVCSYDGTLRMLYEAYAPLFAPLDQSQARAAADGSRYWLQANAYIDGQPEQVFVALRADGTGGCVNRRAVSALTGASHSVFLDDGKACVPAPGNSWEGFFRREWRSVPAEPFAQRALLRELRVRARGELTLTAVSDEGTRRMRVRGTGKPERLACRLPGQTFCYQVSTDTDGEMLSLTAVYECGGGV